MNKNIFIISIIITLVTSCIPRKYLPSSNFEFIDTKDINGKYYINRKDLYEFFNIKAIHYEIASSRKFYGAHKTIGRKIPVNKEDTSLNDSLNLDFVILNFNGKDSLNILYRDSNFWYEVSYKGKFKKNFFEISLQNKRLPFFPLFVRYDVDRIRIGVNSEKKLLVYNYNEHWGMFLLFGAHAGGDEYSISLDKIE